MILNVWHPILALLLELARLPYYIRHVPNAQGIDVELFALRIIEEELLSKLIKEVDIPRIHKRDAVIVPPNLFKF